MKKLLMLFFLFSGHSSYTQTVSKWVFSSGVNSPVLEWTFLNGGPPALNQKNLGCIFLNAAVINKEGGDYVLYSNGTSVYNRWDKALQNGLSLNSPYTNTYDSLLGGYTLILPFPGDSNKHYIFYNSLSGSVFWMPTTPTFYGWGNGQKYVKYAIADMSLNNDSGAVILKNQDLITSSVDTLGFTPFTAVKHGNGRDWWLFIDRFRDDSVFYFRIDPQGIHGPFNQSTMGLIKRMPGWGNSGYMLFSPDGKKFIKTLPRNGLNIYDFDRCTGLLSNPIHIEYPTYYPGTDTILCCPEQKPFGQYPPLQTVAFSANSKYLYWSGDTSVFQYDLNAADIPNSYIKIGKTAIPIGFAKLAPDRKIYLWSGASGYMHVINSPDISGMQCGFQENLFSQLYSTIGYPSYPNYELGPLQGSLCDTISTVSIQEPDIESVKVYPNPASDLLTVEILSEASFTLRNTLGQEILRKAIPQTSKTQINIANIPEGIYFYEILHEKKEVYYGKVIIQRR